MIGLEKTPGLINNVGQTLVMGVGQVPLKGCRLRLFTSSTLVRFPALPSVYVYFASGLAVQVGAPLKSLVSS